MREILFRGKRIFDGKWVNGFAYKQYSAAKVEEWYIRAFETDFLVIPETVSRFTGLADKNGRKIFEGDIVERGGRIWLVEYSNKYGQFMMTTYTEKGISWSRSFDLIPPDWCEVIGNIYDNPELLEGS